MADQDTPGSGQTPGQVESVWDYPRPPRLEGTPRHLRIVHRGVTIAETSQALRILETSHPPVYYLPPGDVAMQWLEPSPGKQSFCEFKGIAEYWSLALPLGAPGLIGPTVFERDVAWSYASPTGRYAALRNYLAFYASRVEACFVDGEQVKPQPGDFYGGWITSHVTGPFKGMPGTRGW